MSIVPLFKLLVTFILNVSPFEVHNVTWDRNMWGKCYLLTRDNGARESTASKNCPAMTSVNTIRRKNAILTFS